MKHTGPKSYLSSALVTMATAMTLNHMTVRAVVHGKEHTVTGILFRKDDPYVQLEGHGEKEYNLCDDVQSVSIYACEECMDGDFQPQKRHTKLIQLDNETYGQKREKQHANAKAGESDGVEMGRAGAYARA